MICAIEDDVVLFEEVKGARGRQMRGVCIVFRIRVELPEIFDGAVDFVLADGGGAVENLPVEVGDLDNIAVGKAESSYAGASYVCCCWTAQATGTDDQNRGLFEP